MGKAKRHELRVTKLAPKAIPPKRQTPGSVGYDLYCLEDTILQPRRVTVVQTGISLEYPPGYYGKIEGRSSLAAQGIITAAGVCDSDYKGEIKAVLVNTTKLSFAFKAGDRVAQMLIKKAHTFEVVVDDQKVEAGTKERGDQGFGSTGQ
jgi:dUTP pyrophosphatase